MNRVYTLTFTDPDEAITDLVRDSARSLTLAGWQVQDQGGSSVSFRVSGPDADERDRIAALAAYDVMAGLDDPWSLVTGLGVHRRVIETRGGEA